MQDRPFDLVLFGATGFTGRLAAEYLATTLRDTPVRWALAGRSTSKLESVRAALVAIDPRCAELPLLQADSADASSLAATAAKTRVVLTTVGPYVRLGEPLVAACVEAGTDYVDITGEPAFVHRMIERYGDAARAAGVRIVSCCGFDSIPHDLGVLFAVRQMPAGEAIEAEGIVRASGTFSGGTWHSTLDGFARMREDRGALRPRPEERDPSRTVRGARPSLRYDHPLGMWLCPLPTIDPLIVLRSARLVPEYGPDFRYGHYAGVRSTLTVAGGAVGLSALVLLAQFKPTLSLLRKVRDPGDGPSPEVRARSKFSVTVRAVSRSKRVVTRVRGGDAGYTETAKMVSEAALCLAFDRDKLPSRVGVLTPAAAMGDALIDRLVRAGIVFETLEARSL